MPLNLNITVTNNVIALGPLDALVLPFCPITVIFVYPRPATESPATFLDVGLLQKALEITLDTYPHLTGRLKLGDGTYPSIVSLGAGAELYTGTSPESLDDFRQPDGRLTMPDLPDYGNPLLAPFDPTPEGVQRQPVLMVKHTGFACGSVGLGVTIHHLACDATGFFQFVRDVSTVYAGLRAGEARPQLPPAHLVAYNPPHTADESTETPEVIRLEFETETVDPSSLEGVHHADEHPVTGRVVRFSSKELAGIKAAATTDSSWVSTHEAVTAHIWQRSYIARVKLLPNESDAAGRFNREFFSSINGRPSNRLGLPARYFPNAIYPPCAKLDHELLYRAPFPEVAAAVHEMYRCPTPDMMDHYPRWLDQQESAGRLKNVRSKFNYGLGSYVVTQWTGFRIYEGVDFDGASPDVVAQPFTTMSLLDGLAMMFSTEEEGSIDANLTFREPVWALLDLDPEFRRYKE